jgi:hypothetical protein
MNQNVLKPAEIFLVMAFFAFIPWGTWVITIAGVRLDILIAAGLLALSLRYFRRTYEYPTAILISILVFLVACLPSVLISPDLPHSVHRWVIIVGYGMIALLSPFILYRQMVAIRYFLLAVATISAVTLISLSVAYSSDAGHIGRLSFSSSGMGKNALSAGGNYIDPNHTAIGLALSIVVYLPNLLIIPEKIAFRRIKVLFEIFSMPLIMTAIVLLLSRTATFSLVLAVGIPMTIAIWVRFRGKTVPWPVPPRIFLTVLLITSLGVATVARDQFWNLAGRSVAASRHLVGLTIPEDITGENPSDPTLSPKRQTMASDVFQSALKSQPHRIELIRKNLDHFSESPQSILFGLGFFTTNPHNEFLRYLTSSGVVGFLAFLAMNIAIFIKMCLGGGSRAYRLHQFGLFAFYLVSIQFYGHTKMLWFPVMVLFANYLEMKYRDRKVLAGGSDATPNT